MARIVDIKKKITTTGELIEALKEFGPDMPLKNESVVYRLWPRRGEGGYDDRRGKIVVEEDDGTLDS